MLTSLGWMALCLLAAAGLTLSTAFVVVSTDLGRRLVVPSLVRLAEEAMAGRIELHGIQITGGGGLELTGLRVFDPDGELVLSVERAHVTVELGRLRSKVIGLRARIENPSVVLRTDPDGGLSIVRAFGSPRPDPGEKERPFDWTIRLARVDLVGGSVRYLDPSGETELEVQDVGIEGRAIHGRKRAALDVSLKGNMVSPERAPISLELVAGLRDEQVRVRQLRASVGETALEVAGEVQPDSWRGRAAVLSVSLSADQVRKLAPDAPLAGDLRGTLYVESDGREATGAVHLVPEGDGGTADAAAAVRLPPGTFGAAAEIRCASLDLGRILRGAPATGITLEASGRGVGQDLASLRGFVAARLAPSRVRTGRVGPIEVRATADRGRFELSRLEGILPGASLSAEGSWQQRGLVSGRLSASGSDLAVLQKNLAALLGRRLPPLAGSGRVEVQLAGTEAAPDVSLLVTAPSLLVAGTSASGLALSANLSGPRSAPVGRASGTIARLSSGGFDAQSVKLEARVDGRAGEASLTGLVPVLGPEPILVAAKGNLAPGGEILTLGLLTLSWPGSRFELQSPARIDLRGPSVDRLGLVSGNQRVDLTGGAKGTEGRQVFDLAATIQELDLGRLPLAFLPARVRPAGSLTAEIQVRGKTAAPDVAARASIAKGAVMGLEEISASFDGSFDGRGRRARGRLTAKRAAGGEALVEGDLPVRLGREAPRSPIAAQLSLRTFPLAELVRISELDLPEQVDGQVSLEVRVSGTVGSPALVATAELKGGRYGELEPIAVSARVEDRGQRAELEASVDYRGARALDATASMPLDPAALLRAPERVARGLYQETLTAKVTLPGLDLQTFAGRLGLRSDLAGRLVARADLSGSLSHPRGEVVAKVANGAYAGYERVELDAALTAADGATSVEARTSLAGRELARLAARLGQPVERLVDRGAREAAPLEARVDVPGADLEKAGVTVPLAGRVAGWVKGQGSLASPTLSAEFTGSKVAVSGHPLGDLTFHALSRPRSLEAALELAAATGGRLEAKLEAEVGLGTAVLRGGEIGRAPARASVVARRLDLRFLPAVAPGVVRSASGSLEADLSASGPLARMIPKGSAKLEGGTASIVEFGDWKEIGLEATLDGDAIRVQRFVAGRGSGKLVLQGEVVGLTGGGAPASVRADVTTSKLLLSRSGDELATVTLEAKLTGKVSRESLTADLTIPSGVVRLPDRLPTRNIQSLAPREDVVVEPFKKRKPTRVASASESSRPFQASVHLVAPGRFFVKGDKPRVDVELRADATAEYLEGELGFTGRIDTLRGQVEPIGSRVFDIKHGRVQFTGAGYETAGISGLATHQNPKASASSPETIQQVNVAVGGTVEKPEIKLTSTPSMSEGQIALYIATGRTELKPGTGGVSDEEGIQNLALGALSQTFFKDVVADKLPVDTVSLDSSRIRAGKYITDKIYVGYTHRLRPVGDASRQKENNNEIQLEYQISPTWNFEMRAGDEGTGGGRLMWSKDY